MAWVTAHCIFFIVTILYPFVKRKFLPAPPAPQGQKRRRSAAARPGGRTFLRRDLQFAPGCGTIIRRHMQPYLYALVAQSVEHLTFNQRAWDSSSHERTKEKR